MTYDIEFFFRARLKLDTPQALVDWLQYATDPAVPLGFAPYDDRHPFFSSMNSWHPIFRNGGGNIWGVRSRALFTPLPANPASYDRPELLVFLQTTGTRYPFHAFVEWIAPHVDPEADYPGSVNLYVGYLMTEHDDAPVPLYLPTPART